MLALLSLLAAAALASADFNLTVPGEGPYKLWTDSKLPEAAPKDAQLIEKNPTPVKAPGAGYVAVLDTQSGNLAIKPLKGLKGDVSLTDADFSLIGEVQVEVTHDGKAVQAANVSVISGSTTLSKMLDSSFAGHVSFYGVKQGRVEVKIEYVSNGKQAAPLDLVSDLGPTRTQPTPVIKAAIADDVATVVPAAAAPTDGSAPPGQEETQPGTSPTPKEPISPGTIVGKTVTILLALGAAGGVIFLIYWLIRKDPKAIADKLTALGVQIPKDPNDAADLAVIQTAAPIRPDPPQKIILDDSDPTPLAPSAAAPVAAVAAGPAGRLVAETGGSVSVPDGTTLIGREATLGLSLPDPSTLSRRHAELVRQGDHLLVRDLGSTNGTYVNGRKIDSDTPLSVGDAVQFGAVRFRVEA